MHSCLPPAIYVSNYVNHGTFNQRLSGGSDGVQRFSLSMPRVCGLLNDKPINEWRCVTSRICYHATVWRQPWIASDLFCAFETVRLQDLSRRQQLPADRLWSCKSDPRHAVRRLCATWSNPPSRLSTSTKLGCMLARILSSATIGCPNTHTQTSQQSLQPFPERHRRNRCPSRLRATVG